MSAPTTIHATTIVIGEAGIIIRGEAGSGKSSLARRLIGQAAALGLFARLVSDDRTAVEPGHGRLVARQVEAIAGSIEVRGIGIIRVPSEPAVVVRLVVDLSDEEQERMPGLEEAQISLCGVLLPRIRTRTGANVADVIMGRAVAFSPPS